MLGSKGQYFKEVTAIATALVAECMSECDNDKDRALELINDSRLHETIDGHQWVIYYAYNLPVLTYSDNTEYGVDSGLVALDSDNFSLNDFHNSLAYWALYADVQNQLDSAFDDYEATQQTEEDEE
jgi:hypothetical protein